MTTPLAALVFALVTLFASYIYIAKLENEIDNLQIEKELCKGCFRCQGLGVSIRHDVAVQMSYELQRLGSNIVWDGVKRPKNGLESLKTPKFDDGHTKPYPPPNYEDLGS